MELDEAIEQAREYLAQDEAGRAQQVLAAQWDDGNRQFELIIELVLCYLVLDELSSARRFLALAESADGNHSRVACYRGLLALAEGRKEDAVVGFNQALQRDPNNAEAYKWRGLCFREMGEHGRALADMDRAAAHLKTDTALLIHRGTVHASLGAHERALDDFERAIALAAHHPHALFKAAHSLAALGRHEEARDYYDTAIELDFLCVEAWLGLASLFASRQRWSEVIRCTATVLAVSADSAPARLLLAQAAARVGDWALTARTLLHVPHNLMTGESHYHNALALYHLKRFDDAWEELTRAIALNSSLGQAWYLGVLLTISRNHPDGGPAKWSSRASEHIAETVWNTVIAAEVALHENDEATARKCLQAAIDRDPDVVSLLSGGLAALGQAASERSHAVRETSHETNGVAEPQ